MSAEPVALVHGVTFSYPSSPPVLQGVDLEIQPGDFLGLVGPNGGGKTTLLRVLLGLVKPQQGSVTVLGRRPGEVSARVGYVPQHTRIDLAVPAEVLDVVLMGRLAKTSWGPRFGREDVAAALRALELTGAAELAGRRFGELSGGQRQRILIARALAADVELLLLDEPTTGVDLHRERALFELLRQLNQRLPIVLVSHDVTLVSSHLKRAAWVNRRVNCYPASELSPEIIESLYHGADA